MKKLLLSVFTLSCFAGLGQWAATTNNTSNDVISAFGKVFSSDCLISGTSGLYSSTDNGSTWNTSNTGVPTQGLKFGTASSNNLYAYNNFSVYSSSTGNNWSLMSTPMTSSQTIQSMTPLSPLNVTVLAAVSPTTGMGFKVYQGNGSSWILKSSPVNSCIPTVLRDLSGTLYAGTTNTSVLKSTDGGVTWTGGLAGMPTEAPNKYISSLASSGNTLFCGTIGGKIVRSTDAGGTWTTIYNIGDNTGYYGINDFYIHNTNTIFAATDSGFVYTTNGGNTWTRYNTGLNFGNFENLMKRVTVSGAYVVAGVNTSSSARVMRMPLSSIGLTAGINELADGKPENKVYPNPTSGNVTIEVSNLTFDDNYNVKLYDVTGREVLVATMSGGKAELNLENYSKGLYTFTVSNKNNIASRGKLMVH